MGTRKDPNSTKIRRKGPSVNKISIRESLFLALVAKTCFSMCKSGYFEKFYFFESEVIWG